MMTDISFFLAATFLAGLLMSLVRLPALLGFLAAGFVLNSLGVEELPYLEEYLTDIEVADARSPRYCKGYPECNDCACTRKVRFEGEPLMDHLRSTVAESREAGAVTQVRPTRWLGWRGRLSPEEAERNRAC